MASEVQKIWSLYKITNKINGKVYIGQAADISKRWHDHRAAAKNNKPTQIIHQISKQIVNSLKPGDTIVLENLTGIRNKRLRKAQRKLINNWSYFQLEQFITYKAAAKGISVKHIDARYTSQRCSRCGFICRSNRKSQSDFCCNKCGFRLNADLNASRNICNKHLDSYKLSDRAAVNQPIVGAEKLLTSQ